jgi:hypothetical protein
MQRAGLMIQFIRVLGGEHHERNCRHIDGALTASRRILHVQAAPASVALILLRLA